MRTIEILALKYDELADKAKERAYNNWLEHADYPYASENESVLKEFEKMLPIRITHWQYGDRGERVDWYFDGSIDPAVEDLTGIRLATYLWNNFKDNLFKGKYYHSQAFGLTDHKIIHPRVRSKQITTKCSNQGKWNNSYYSGIILEHSCVLTGYCVDDYILKPIYSFLDSPNTEVDFEGLINDCFHEWIRVCREDMEYYYSEKNFAEECESNDWEFNEDGIQI